jgi:hypothetical protein
MAEGFNPITVQSVQTIEGLNELNRMLGTLFNNMAGDGDMVKVYNGYGVPTIAAGVGSLYLRLDGGANTTLYVKEATGTWTAK